MKARTLLFLALFLTLSTAGIFSQSATIGAWNIQWLGSADQRPNIAKNKAQKAEDLADYGSVAGITTPV